MIIERTKLETKPNGEVIGEYVGSLDDDFAIYFKATDGLIGLHVVAGEIDVFHQREHVLETFCHVPQNLKSALRKFKECPEKFECEISINDFMVIQ